MPRGGVDLAGGGGASGGWSIRTHRGRGGASREHPMNWVAIAVLVAGLTAMLTLRFHHALREMTGGRVFTGSEVIRSITMILAMLLWVLLMLAAKATLPVLFAAMTVSFIAAIGIAYLLTQRG